MQVTEQLPLTFLFTLSLHRQCLERSCSLNFTEAMRRRAGAVHAAPLSAPAVVAGLARLAISPIWSAFPT